MPSLSFMEWKAQAVLYGTCTQTIRRTLGAARRGAKLIFKTSGQTEKQCKLGEGVCLGTEAVILRETAAFTMAHGWQNSALLLQAFAEDDGFRNYANMWDFFHERYYMAIQEHNGEFRGHRIWWKIDREAQQNAIKNY